MSKLYIKVVDGAPVDHPIVEANLLDAYEISEVTPDFLEANSLAVFERPDVGPGFQVTNQIGYELGEDGVVRPVIETRELSQAEKVDAWVRAPRNHYLATSDWTQMADSPLSSEQKAAWAAYRQELRDLPEVYQDIQDPAEIVPPTPPGAAAA